jgi:hypothetical protein
MCNQLCRDALESRKFCALESQERGRRSKGAGCASDCKATLQLRLYSRRCNQRKKPLPPAKCAHPPLYRTRVFCSNTTGITAGFARLTVQLRKHPAIRFPMPYSASEKIENSCVSGAACPFHRFRVRIQSTFLLLIMPREAANDLN